MLNTFYLFFGIIFLSSFSSSNAYSNTVLCFTDTSVYFVNKHDRSLPLFVDVDLKHQATHTGIIQDGVDHFSISRCYAAGLYEYLELKEKNKLAKNPEVIWNSNVKINIHNNIFINDLGLYHLTYFPYELYTPSSRFVKTSTLRSSIVHEFDELNSEAARLWSVLNEVCTDGNAHISKIKYYYASKLCGDESADLKKTFNALRTNVLKYINGNNQNLKLSNEIHPLLVQIILEQMIPNIEWGGPQYIAKDFNSTKRHNLDRQFRALDNVSSCHQFGLWPFASRSYISSILSLAALTPGLNDRTNGMPSFERILHKSRRICGAYSSSSPFYELEFRIANDFNYINFRFGAK